MAQVIINEIDQKVVVRSAGAPGRTIISGSGAPVNTVGVPGDFYFDTDTTRFYGPKPLNNSWATADSFILNKPIATVISWELAQVTGPVSGVYSVIINHDLGFNPNVTVKASSGDELETGITYNNSNSLTLTMAQPFSGTAYLS